MLVPMKSRTVLRTVASALIFFTLLTSAYAGTGEEAIRKISERIGGAVDGMYRNNPELSIGSQSFSVGPFPWESGKAGTAFSRLLGQAAERAILGRESLQLITQEPAPFFGDQVPQQGSLKGGTTPLSAYRLYGSYRIQGSDVLIALKIYSFSFSRLMAEQEVSIPLSIIPGETSLYPENREMVEQLDRDLGQIYDSSELSIHITTDRGEGGIYRDGEEMILSLLADRDCYIKILHIDGKGIMTQVFPNRFENNNFLPGRELLTFPGRRSPFRFKVVPPYGTETIKVIASTRQFSDLNRDFQQLGMASRGLALVGVEEEEQEIMADATVHFTILKD